MSMVRHFCAVLGLLSVLNSSASEAPYPEVFDEFITGWVDYDDGYYAAALRAFARAHALDPEFRPAAEAMAASLGQMGMPEIGASILRDRWVSKGSEYTYRPAIAFWGVFHSAEINKVSTSGLEQAVTDTLGNLLDTPVALMSPATSTWAERKKQQPCAYNLLIFLFQEPGKEYAIARIHLIRNYSVASGKELDLALSTIPNQLAHQAVEIKLNTSDIAQLSDNQAFSDGLLELFDRRLEIENPAYRIDAETEALLDTSSDEDAWVYLSKASVSTEFALDSYKFLGNFRRPNDNNGAALAALYAGFPEWLAHQLEIEHPMRPWLLAEARHANHNSFRWHAKKARELREELIHDHPDHPALLAIQLCRETWGLHHLNYKEKMPLILPYLEKLRRLPPELFRTPRDFEYLERFYKTTHACLGEPVDEPFVPFIIFRGSQKMAANDGAFRLSFTGSAPKTLDGEVHAIDDHEQFAAQVLIHKLFAITDASVLLKTYKEHVQRDDALGTYLKRIKNGVLHTIKTSGDKETYKEACEWWLQNTLDLIETDATWAEISRVLPRYARPLSESARLRMLAAVNRRLEERGLLQNDENSGIAFNCGRLWKISFLELSPRSQQAVIVYHRDRAANDRSYFEYLAWLYWSDAKQLFHSETLHGHERYIANLNTGSNSKKRGEDANKYGQLLIAAGEPLMALDVIASVLPNATTLERTNDSDLETHYALCATRAKALAGVGRLDEANQEINEILEEIDGQKLRYQELNEYGRFMNPRHHSLSSALLKLKDEIQEKE